MVDSTTSRMGLAGLVVKDGPESDNGGGSAPAADVSSSIPRTRTIKALGLREELSQVLDIQFHSFH